VRQIELTNMLSTAGMLVDVIFGSEKLLGLVYGRVQFDPAVEVGDT
jgi:hypothetical protein